MFDSVIGEMVIHFEREGMLDRRPMRLALERDKENPRALSFPGKVLADEEEQSLFIADTNHNRILVAALDDGQILDVIGGGEAGLADGSFEEARFRHPQGMARDGDYLYIADTENHAIRRADLARRQVETIAGNGSQASDYDSRPSPAKGRAMNSPWDLELVHGVLFIAMAGSHQIWGLDLEDGIIAGHAGSGGESHVDGSLLQAALAQPSGLTTDGEVLFFADSEISSIRTADLDPRGGNVRTIVGEGLFDYGDVDGVGADVRLQHPMGLVYVDGMLYVADTYNNKIKRLQPLARSSATFAGSGEAGLIDGPGVIARFNEPAGVSAAGGKLYIADTNNHAIRVVDISTRNVSTFALKGELGFGTAD
jgi:sugar lactone lactonase YvrE